MGYKINNNIDNVEEELKKKLEMYGLEIKIEEPFEEDKDEKENKEEKK